MASNNEINSQISCNDKSLSKKHLNEHEETIKMASKKSLSNEEQIASMDENDLKNLLDEALTYKNPRDANEKSETFKRLLQNVTEEEEHKRKFESNSLHWKAQSNSLQNLLDESHYQLQNPQSQISSKKHQQRRKNSTSVSTRRVEGGSLPFDMHYSSAIQSPPDQPFLSELKNNKKRKEKQHAKDTVIDMLDIETDDRKSFQRCLDPNKDTTTYHDAIEMKPFANNKDDQSSSKFTTANSTPNTITTIASLITSANPIPTLMTKAPSANLTSVDTAIPFTSILEKPKSYQQAQTMDTFYQASTINHNNNIVLTGGPSSYSSSSSGGKLVSGADQPLQLPSGVGVNSVMDSKSFSYPKYKTGQSRDDVSSLIQTTPSILTTSHSSTTTTNSKDSKASKKRTAKSERNEKKINVESIEGYRGFEPLEKLLTYIDGQHNNPNNNNNNNPSNNNSSNNSGQKNHPKNGIVSNSSNDTQANEQLLNADDKKNKQKLVSKNKEKMNKLKKSNSMDELCSTGRQQEKSVAAANDSSTANKIVQDVTLRSKNNNNSSNNNTSNMTSGAKKVENTKMDKSQTKRNERRSWGTEGLWPDTTASNDIMTTATTKSEQIQDDNQENESSSSSSVQLDFTTSDPINLTSNNVSNNSNNVNVNTLESINATSEADKFQVVIKKKKVKRKSSENSDVKTPTSHNLQPYVIRRDGNLRSTGTKSSTTNSNNEGRNNDKNSTNNNNNNHNNSNNNNSNHKNSSKQMSHDAKQKKNRRKSTSSMPPSDEDGEYSDGGDSVQSLPIETTKTTSSLLSAPNNNHNNNNNHHSSAENSGKMMINKKNASSNPTTQQTSPLQQITIQQQQQQKPAAATFSYADIAKTNTNRTNNNSSNNNNVMPASTEKMWPSISSSSSSHQNNTNSNNTIINNNNNNNNNNSNVINNDPFAISNFDAINNNINNNSNNNNNNSNNSSTVANPSTKQQQKSTPSINNTMSFPDLVVESNNNRNKLLSNSPMDITSNGDATQTEKSLNGMERVAFDNNNNPSTTTDRLNNNNNNNNNNKISYSQSLLENHNHQEIDANGNNSNIIISNPTKLDNATNINTISIKNVLIKSKSVDHNNLSSIEHYPALEKTKQTLSDVLSKPLENLSGKTTKVKQQQQPQMQQIQKVAVTVEPTVVKDDNCGKKNNKKDKMALKKSTSTVSTSTSNQQYSTQNSNNMNNNNPRPAVIIMNDYEKSSEVELGITFGFDINEHLLFGHQNGDAVADHSVEMNNTNSNNIKNNNSNCDIINTNLSSNINNLTNQSCGFEIYDNFISSPPQSVMADHSQQMMQHQVTIIQSSPKTMSNNSIKDNTTLLLDSSNQSSNDLGYMSSSLITNSTTSPANQKISNDIQHQTQPPNSDNNYENEFGHQNSSYHLNNAMDIKQRIKLDELISRFVSPEPAKNFNYDELVTFVSEEWTKVERNGVIFNGQ